MRRSLIFTLLISLIGISPAAAHQPVVLLDTDTTAAKGPLLVDGTISFAVRAAFSKSGQKKGFRFGMKEGEQLSLQYLIVDKQPENKLKTNQLPVVVLVSPTGAKFTLKINERSKFYEPFGKTNYLYLARYSSIAITGTYSVEITSKAKAAITIAVGDKEVSGDVVRGSAPSAAPKPSASPTPSTTSSELTLNKVKENNTASSCWSIINGNVYNLTNWIGSHPGGRSAITSLCGVDGTAAFNAQHRGEPRPESRLASYLLGKLNS